MEKHKKQVIIIGAGPAGLTAAYDLMQKSGEYHVLILEQSSEIGGLSRTVRHEGNRMDIGGHRFFSKIPDVQKLWNELLPMQGKPAKDDYSLKRIPTLSTDGPDPETEDQVMLHRQRVSRIFYLGKFFDYPVKMNWNTFRNLGFKTVISSGFSYLKSCVRKLPEENLEQFYINRFGKKLYTLFFERYTEKLWGRHPREISAEWGGQRVKGLSIYAIFKNIFSKFSLSKQKKHVETSLIESFQYPKYGPGQLWETMADRIRAMGGTIQLQTTVTKFRMDNGKISSVIAVSDDNETEYPCDLLFSSMPMKELAEGLPDLPEKLKQIAAGLPYRDFITVGLLLKNLKIKHPDRKYACSIPDCWIYVQDPGVSLGRIQIFNNWSPYLTPDPEHTVWIGLEYFCKEGDPFWTLTESELVRWGIHDLEQIGMLHEGERPLTYHVEKVKKAYPAYFGTYAEISSLISFLNTIPNLYCIGRNGQHRYNNMDHSMLTAMEAVNNILHGNRNDKSSVWNVNTEKEYHEEAEHRPAKHSSPKE